MGDFATVMLKGRVVGKPELRARVAHFAVAIRAPSGSTSYIECEAWDERATWCVGKIERGDPVVIQGELYESKWTAKDGSARKEVRVKVWRVEWQEGRQAPTPASKSIDELLDSV